jgi:hypothetical protein
LITSDHVRLAGRPPEHEADDRTPRYGRPSRAEFGWALRIGVVVGHHGISAIYTGLIDGVFTERATVTQSALDAAPARACDRGRT